MTQSWRTVRVTAEDYSNIIKLKSMAELSTREDFSIGEIVGEAVDMALAHVEEGLASWKREK